MVPTRARCSTKKGSARICTKNCVNQPSAKQQTASMICLDMFGPSVLFCCAATGCDGAKVSLATLRNTLQSYADSGILRTCWQMLASPTQKEASALYCSHAMQQALFTLLAGCEGVSSGSVTLFVSCEDLWPRLQGGCISGRLRPTHLLAQVDDSKTMGYVLTGRLLFWSSFIKFWSLKWVFVSADFLQTL